MAFGDLGVARGGSGGQEECDEHEERGKESDGAHSCIFRREAEDATHELSRVVFMLFPV